MATQQDQQVGLPVARCPQCNLVVYPASVTICPRCTASPMDPVSASGDGTVWTYTVQRFAPKSPPYRPCGGGFEPFIVAYVETDEGVRIEGIVEDIDPAQMRIGLPVRLVSVSDVPRYAPSEEVGQL